MKNPLDTLISDGLLDDVLGQLKSGKEAEVYRVVYRGEVVAAKVYKDRAQRSFQHNSAYKEGRSVRNSRTQRAIDKGSRFGRGEDEDEWKASEARCLHTLHAAGVRVPVPVMFYEGVLMMQLVTDADGDPAPRLVEANIPVERAAELYRDLRGQIVKMLCCDLIHGDLSPYNVLLAADGPTIIDFPQTIAAAQNSQSERFFKRDYDAIHGFFARIDGRLWAFASDGAEIWRTYVRRELTPDFVPVPRAREPRPPRPFTPPPRGPGYGPNNGPNNGPNHGPNNGPRGGGGGGGGGGARPQDPGNRAPAQRSGPPPQRTPAGPIVTYARRTGDRESPPTVTTPRPGRPVPAPREPAAPDGNPHRRRKHKGS